MPLQERDGSDEQLARASQSANGQADHVAAHAQAQDDGQVVVAGSASERASKAQTVKTTPLQLSRSQSGQGSSSRKGRLRSASPAARQDAADQHMSDLSVGKAKPAKMQSLAGDRPRSRRSVAGDNTRQSQSSGSRAASPVSSTGGPDLDLVSLNGDDIQAGRRSLRRQRSHSPETLPTAEARRISADSTEPGSKRAMVADQRLNPHKRAREAKRIKISSPSKQRREPSVELGILPSETKTKSLPTEADPRTRPQRDDDQNSNDEHCYACQGTGKLLCCDDCPKSFHFTCIEPPIEEADIPDEPFYCMSCWDAKFGFPRPGPGLFQQLQLNEIARDPTVYLPPADVRGFFEGISTGEGGVYRETRDQKNPRKDRHGFAEELDPFRLRDKNNKPLLCYRCGGSALNGRGMASCDHCTAHWHLDCVVPPLPNPPSNLKKWMCPLHSHDVAPTVRKLKNAVVRDTALSRGHANRGDILVAMDDVPADPHVAVGQGLQPWPVHDMAPVQYRIPERGIVLDFLDRVHDERHARREHISDALPFALRVDAATDEASSRAARESSLRELVRLACEELSIDRLWSSREERTRLLAVKALCEAKGEEALMSFLTG